MSSPAPHMCLFCTQLNSADAIFCNQCGTHLNLQPCHQCNAAVHRAARACYQCGEALANFDDADLLVHPVAARGPAVGPPGLNHAGVHPGESTDLDSWRQQAPAGAQRTASQTMAAGDTGASSALRVATVRSRRRWLAVVAVLLAALLVDAVFVYVYYGQPVQLAQLARWARPPQGTAQAAPALAAGIVAAPPGEAVVIGSPLKATATLPDPAQPVAGLAAVAASEPQDVLGALAVGSLSGLPARVRRAPPVFTDCPQAVAALGFCDVDIAQEKP